MSDTGTVLCSRCLRAQAQRREVVSFRTQVVYQHTRTTVVDALPPT